MPDQELRRRVITAMGIGTVIIAATLGGILSCYVLVAVIVVGSSIEFFRMQSTRDENQSIYGSPFLSTVPVLALILISILDKDEVFHMGSHGLIASLAVVFGVYFFTQMATEIVVMEKRLFAFSASLLLFTIPGIFAVFLCNVTPKLLLGIFILLWSSDVFAYFGGRAFGRHKLLPSVSPKKTWEGLLSGLVATAFAAWGLSYLFIEITAERWIITGLLVVIFGAAGDLLQSVFKRGAGVKDSGNILPGHGGLWDRFDSFLGCLPWIGAYYLFM